MTIAPVMPLRVDQPNTPLDEDWFDDDDAA
jgi:hypothetical protein